MNDLSAQIFMYLPFGTIFLIVFICICRLHFDRKTDERAEAELENIERITDRAECEAGESTERAAEIAERISDAGKQIESASESVEAAQGNNRTAEEAVSRIEEILSQAKKI
jgi:hypothetical protein